ncbi:MAG: hypothetical protein VX346_19110, partial [Planctomycetota bacterium]|nr:hypothetical protein [Planctomycetota bacterium]
MKLSMIVGTALLSMVWLAGCGAETESGGGLPPADAVNGGTGEAMLDAASTPAPPGAPGGDTPAEEAPAEEKPAEEKPAEEAPAEEKAAEEKPAEEAPGEEEPAEEKPAVEGPA